MSKRCLTIAVAFLISGALALTAAIASAEETSGQIVQQPGPSSGEHMGPVKIESGPQVSSKPEGQMFRWGEPVKPMNTMMNRDMMGQMPQASQVLSPNGNRQTNTYSSSRSGEATVARADRNATCLRVREGSSASSKEVACVPKGEKVHLTGVFSRNRRWAQLENHGWVPFSQLKTDVIPPQAATRGRSWEQSAGAGKGPSGVRGHRSARLNCCCPSYYGWGWY